MTELFIILILFILFILLINPIKEKFIGDELKDIVMMKKRLQTDMDDNFKNKQIINEELENIKEEVIIDHNNKLNDVYNNFNEIRECSDRLESGKSCNI